MTPHRVLVVDDDPPALDPVCQLLDGERMEIVTARDGEEAVPRVEEWRSDLIFLDLMMPRMDGFEVIERLRDLDEAGEVPTIVLTPKQLSGAAQVPREQGPGDRREARPGARRAAPGNPAGAGVG